MDKPVITLDKAEIIDKMWDTCNGNHVLAVAPDGRTILAGDGAGSVYCLRSHL